MKIQITFDANEYRRNGQTPAQIASQLRADIHTALAPILTTLGQVLQTGDLHVDGDFLETHVGQARDHTDQDWQALYADLLEGKPAYPHTTEGVHWIAIYKALVSQRPIPTDIDQDDVIDAVSELYRDTASGWLKPAHVRRWLPDIERLCTQHRCIDLYDQLAALVQDRTWPHITREERRGHLIG